MHFKVHVAVATSGDVKVSLDFVSVETAVQATCVGIGFAPDLWCWGEFAFSSETKMIVDVVFFIVLDSSGFVEGVEHAVLDPIDGCSGQSLACENAVASSVLDVDAHVITLHCDDHVNIDLQVV